MLGQALPGGPFEGNVEAGQAVRVMTGAPVPAGADAVVMAEVCEEADGRVAVSDAVAPRKNIGAVGEDIRRGDLVLRVGTTGGNELRELQQQLLQAGFADAGIQVDIDNVPGADYFGERPFSEQAIAASTTQGAEGDPTIWDLTQFAWVGGPWPGGQSASYLCGNGNNPYGYCNPAFDARASECDGTIDNAERAACYNELNRYVTTLEIDAENGLFMLPITQKPSFYGYLSSVLDQNGATGDANRAGPIANIVDYRFG